MPRATWHGVSKAQRRKTKSRAETNHGAEMPIFTKNEHRIFFAHVPKTAGLSIYALFMENGFSVSQLELGQDLAAQKLKERYGSKIMNNTNWLRSSQTLQHTPYRTWKKWGPFDQSFAIIRDPTERFLSTVKYKYMFTNSAMGIAEFTDRCAAAAMKKAWRKRSMWDGHLLPQHAFLGPDTKAYWFGHDFIKQICVDFDLRDPGMQPANVSKGVQPSLSTKVRHWVERKYAKDYDLIAALDYARV